MKSKTKKRDFPFTQVSNKLLNDMTISLKAKGLYSFMYSKENNWNFTIVSMSKQLREGPDSIRTAIKELRNKGWISYSKRNDGTGVYFIDISPNLENPVLAETKNPNLENPNKGKSNRINNKDLINNKDNSNTKENILKENSDSEVDLFGEEKKEKKVTRQKKEKSSYGEYQNVFLSHDEYLKIQQQYPNDYQGLISFLDEYIEEKSYKSKSHYLAIKRWVLDAYKEKLLKLIKNNKQNEQHEPTLGRQTQSTYNRNKEGWG